MTSIAAAPAAPAPAASIRQAGALRSGRIESLRAVAALAVLVGHAFLIALAYTGTSAGVKNQAISGGLLGVFLFFTLSGYLLYWPFAARQFGDGRRIDLARYVRNRALRILPLYYAAVAVLLAFEPLGAPRSDWWRFALFVENYSPRTVERLDSPLWSLSVELQFYLLLPLLAAAIAWLARRSLRRATIVIALLGAASLGLRLSTVLLSPTTDFSPLDGPLSLPTLFYFFCTGMLIALARVMWERRTPSWARGALGAPDCWLLAAVPLWCAAASHPRWEPLMAAASLLTVAACVLSSGRGLLVRLLDWRPLAALGVASYSLYVWHVPLLVALSGTRFRFFSERAAIDLSAPQSFKQLLALSLPVCIVAAGASYAVIEAPFLRLRRRWSSSASTSSYSSR